jgi:hypothetical protein
MVVGTGGANVSERPNFIRLRMEIEEAAGEGDLCAAYAPFGRTVGLARLGINLETLNLQPSGVSALFDERRHDPATEMVPRCLGGLLPRCGA